MITKEQQTAYQRWELASFGEAPEQVPAQDAAVVRGYHLEGKTYHEISRDLGLPMNSIGPMLSRARQRLRQRPVRS